MNAINQSALREVFSICDDDNDGYISIERFFQVAKENFSQWENNKDTIIKIADLLNQNQFGLINFENFCDVITRILYLDDDVDSGAWSSKSQETPKTDCLASLDEFIYEDLHGKQDLNSTSYEDDQHSYSSVPQSRMGSFRKMLPNSDSKMTESYNYSLSNGNVDDNSSYYSLLGEKVNKLEEQLQNLSGNQLLEEQIRNRLKDENSTYINKIFLLEEQLREMELTSQERFLEERRKREEFLAKTDKDKTNQIEILTESLKLIEKEYKNLLEEVPLIKSENEKLKQLNKQLILEQQRLESSNAHFESEEENLRLLFQLEINKIKEERDIHSQLVDELSEELKELRKYKSDSIHSSPQDSKIPRSARKEIELQIENIRRENIELRVKCEDLQGQLLYKQYNHGLQLVGDQQLNTVFSEISTMSKDELLRIIRNERDRNLKLNEYIDNVLLRIIESNPNLLEIKNNCHD